MILKTKRLILRKPKLSDWKDILDGAGNLDVSRCTTRIPYPYSKKDALKWLKKSINSWNEKKSYAFMIQLISEKKVIGCVALNGVDKFDGTATTGSWINSRYWEKGYITEAKIAANNFAFNRLKLRKLKSKIRTDNKASNKTQQSLGYKFEGCMRKDAKSMATGRIEDQNIYGLFKEDWIKNLPKIKKKLDKKIKFLSS